MFEGSSWIVNADPTVETQLLLAFVGVFFWIGFRTLLKYWLDRNTPNWPWFQSLHDGPWLASELGGVDYKDGFMGWVYIVLHHTVAGSLCLAAYITGESSYLRWGILTSISGVDVLDLIYMIFRWWPWHLLFDEKTGKIHDLALPGIAHHLCTIVAFIPMNVYYSANTDIQMLAACMLGGSAITIAANLTLQWLSRSLDTSSPSVMIGLLVLEFANAVGFLLCRFYFFPISGYSLMSYLYSSGNTSDFYVFGVGIALLSVFNIVTQIILVLGFMANLKKYLPRMSAAARIAKKLQ